MNKNVLIGILAMLAVVVTAIVTIQYKVPVAGVIIIILIVLSCEAIARRPGDDK